MFLGGLLLFWPLFSEAQNEVGPEGYKLLWIFFALFFLLLLLGIINRRNRKSASQGRGKVQIALLKNTLYYPTTIEIEIKNIGSTDVDLAEPLLVFDNFWLKRKFQIRGTNKYSFYPLYLEQGKEHRLRVELKQFYAYDKRLRNYPKITVRVCDVNGRTLGIRSLFVRKTLIPF